MYIIYCDGSSKKTNQVVIGIVVAKISDKYKDRIETVTYLYKNKYAINYQENLHEILACLEGLKLIKTLGFEKEGVLIVNDSIADILRMNQFKKDRKALIQYKDSIDVSNLLEETEDISLKYVYFQQMPRTTLGMNVADFLNSQENRWINPDEKFFIEKQIDKMINRPIDYNISSKNTKTTFKK